jgi:hypothetical protein
MCQKFRDFGVEETCGFVEPGFDLEPQKLRLEFRTNRR